MSKTLLKKIKFSTFRALNNVDIEFGTDITLICGKNGTAKSTILGIAAQIFSFDKDYSTNSELTHKTISDDTFKSQYSEHFRVSPEFDTTGSMNVQVEVVDGYTNKTATGELALTMRGGKNPRAVVRKNSTVPEGKNRDRNFTHPVIFLSLKRLHPIASREKYEATNFPYLSELGAV